MLFPIYLVFLAFYHISGDNWLVSAASSRTHAVEALFRAHQVVRDLIPHAPFTEAQVRFPSGVQMQMGNELTPTQTQDQPEVWWDAKSNELYTLVLVDADSPTRILPILRSCLCWLVINIPGNDITSGETYTEYIGAGPAMLTGLHRYVLLIYKQLDVIKSNLERTSARSFRGRFSFNLRQFTYTYGLGEPIAGNFYRARYDDSVPDLHSQLLEEDLL